MLFQTPNSLAALQVGEAQSMVMNEGLTVSQQAEGAVGAYNTCYTEQDIDVVEEQVQFQMHLCAIVGTDAGAYTAYENFVSFVVIAFGEPKTEICSFLAYIQPLLLLLSEGVAITGLSAHSVLPDLTVALPACSVSVPAADGVAGP